MGESSQLQGVMMTTYIQLMAYLEHCEDELARLIGNCIAHGALTADETRKLRIVAGELKALDCDIGEQVAGMEGQVDWTRSPERGATIH